MSTVVCRVNAVTAFSFWMSCKDTECFATSCMSFV